MNVLSLLLIVVLSAQVVLGQAPSPVTPASPGRAADSLPTPPANFEYQPDGRRDPFVNLVNRGTDARGTAPVGARPDGAAGIAVDEVVVRGILQSRGGWIAMIAAPTGRTYTIKPGDRLLDGSVRTINAQSVLIMQEVNDPLSIEKQREVRKFLRGEVK
jgi:Tfp pilus assembly protein PilP